MTRQGEPTERAIDEAARLLADADRRGLHAEDDATFIAWRDGSHVNAAAAALVLQARDDAGERRLHPGYAELMGAPTLRERVMGVLHSARDALSGTVLTPARLGFAALCLALMIAGGVMLRPATPEYRTRIAEIRELKLDDGSRVTLGARSEISRIAFSDDSRRVKMGVGEAFFEVAKAPDRPFLVEAGDTLIRVVGTRFDVKFDGAAVKVSVLEGVVRVMPGKAGTSAADRPYVTLSAGEQAIVPNMAATLPRPTAIRGTPPGSWREGRLSYADAPLSEVIADANRYRTGRITIVSPSLRDEPVTAAFKTSETDQMLDMLATGLNVQVIRHGNGEAEIRER